MAQKETHTERTEKPSLPNLIPAEFAAMGKRRFDELVAMQTERLERLQEANRDWFDRMQAEATLASEFSTKLAAARSVPEVATAYQEWGSRHMEMAAEDAKRMIAEGRVSRASREYPRRATVREMKEGPSGSAIRC